VVDPSSFRRTEDNGHRLHSFAEVVPLLTALGYRVVVPYLRGYGTTRFRSAATPRNGQQAVIGVDTIARMDALGIERGAG
jgi:pimeloyl-ACP methyl ester carboxylesterase